MELFSESFTDYIGTKEDVYALKGQIQSDKEILKLLMWYEELIDSYDALSGKDSLEEEKKFEKYLTSTLNIKKPRISNPSIATKKTIAEREKALEIYTVVEKPDKEDMRKIITSQNPPRYIEREIKIPSPFLLLGIVGLVLAVLSFVSGSKRANVGGNAGAIGGFFFIFLGFILVLVAIVLLCNSRKSMKRYKVKHQNKKYLKSEYPQYIEKITEEKYQHDLSRYNSHIAKEPEQIAELKRKAEKQEQEYNEKYTTWYLPALEEYNSQYASYKIKYKALINQVGNVRDNVKYIIDMNHYTIPSRYDYQTLLDIFEAGRADTFKEAFNVYIADVKANELLEAEERRFEEIERHNHEMERYQRNAQDVQMALFKSQEAANREAERHYHEMERSAERAAEQAREASVIAERERQRERDSAHRRGANQCALCARTDCRWSMRTNNDGHCTSFVARYN